MDEFNVDFNSINIFPILEAETIDFETFQKENITINEHYCVNVLPKDLVQRIIIFQHWYRLSIEMHSSSFSLKGTLI